MLGDGVDVAPHVYVSEVDLFLRHENSFGLLDSLPADGGLVCDLVS